MAQTITEKILAAHSGQNQVHPGQFVMARLDLMLGNDVTAPLAIEEFRKITGDGRLPDQAKVVLIADHGTPIAPERVRELLAVDVEINAQGIEVWLDRGRDVR